jgi:cell division protein FtsI/penicillin-binding protein 2
MDKALLSRLVGSRALPAENAGYLKLEGPDGRDLFARTTLDEALQAKALQWISQSGAVRAALVAVNPMTGEVLALAGTEVDGRNSALSGAYPAASVFKMVTAAAAVETAGFSSASELLYDGAKHTLYKSNVAKGIDKGVHKATLLSSFAESVNSVFGKLGAHVIGADGLAAAADRFGFNRALSFEMPLEASTFDLGKAGPADPGVEAGDSGDGLAPALDALPGAAQKPLSGPSQGALSATGRSEPLQGPLPAPAAKGAASEGARGEGLASGAPAESGEGEIFHLAELASGFNRATRISPVHGALMAASAINGGVLYEPTVIKEVFDKKNEVLYQSFPAKAGLVLGEKAAGELRSMMAAAVYEGTGRKQFSDALDHRVLSKLQLGGKSGSINDDYGSKVDWFVAFARPGDDQRGLPPLALAAVVVHQGHTRVSSQELVRRSLLSYYGERLSALEKPKAEDAGPAADGAEASKGGGGPKSGAAPKSEGGTKVTAGPIAEG